MTEQKKTADDIARRMLRLMRINTLPPKLVKGSTVGGTTSGGGSSGGGSGFANPMTAVGDVIRGGTDGAAVRLPIGSAGQVLTVVSGKPAWSVAGSGASDEQVRDVVGATLVAGSGITITVNDLADTITLAATATAGGQYRQDLYTTYAGGDLLYDTGGHLMYTLEDLE
jgi:hypothetical protein